MNDMPPRQPAPLRLVQAPSPAAALGLAVGHLMTKPAFAAQPFGEWSRVLAGQINRGHYAFVGTADNRIVGFLGYALTSLDRAEAWTRGVPLAADECREGDCIIINAWSADSPAVVRLLLDALRPVGHGRRFVFFLRRYPDGRTRPSRLSVNRFVGNHVARRRHAR